NNVNPDGAVVETDGLLYNVLVHDNTVKEGSAAVVLDEHAAAIHVTAPGEGAQIGGTGKIINTINGEVTSVSGNAYSPLYVGDYITDDTHLRYQLSDQKDAVLFGIGALQEAGVDHEGNPVTTIGGYTVPEIRNGKEYTDIIDLSTDCDVLGNVRLFTDKFHGEGEVIRPDYGCFETWNTTPQKVVNVSDNYYPHAGSVVYVGKESEVRLTDALTKDFAPSYLLLHHAAGLRTGEHAVSLYNLAIERDLKPLINDTTASWDMVSLPFSLEVGNGTMLNGITIDGLPVEAIQAGDESGDDKNRLYLYEYDGAKRAEDLYSVVAPQNSKYWAFENNQMGANVGYLMATPSASDAVTVRFSKSSSALPVYEESAEEGKSILLKQHNLKTLVGGRPHFTYKENMGWNLFGVPYLCSYATERMSIDHILYTYDPEASRFVSINSWEGNTIAPFSAVFTQTATVKESEELLFAKPVIPLNTLPAPHGVQLKISGSNLSAGCDYVSVIADNMYGEPMNFDMGNDALKMMSFDPRIPQIYVYNEKGVRFAHTQTADIEGETPVGIYTGESGIYEISLTEDSEYDRYDAVVLTDRSTGRKVDLKHAPYSFTVDDRAMETGRFSLSFKTLSDEMQQPTFYSPGKRQLRIVNLQGGESIGIYDTLGRQRASRKAYGESEEFELESGVYMIRIEGSSLVKGKVVVK
ncbi:MAG: T9SS type A sorting domain-containing protein, partial [Barnesiella intestinihominis]